MKKITIKDLMVPISEYATVTKGASLYDAVLALEKAQEEFEHKHFNYRHRAILVLDENNQVIGKLSQLDVLHALKSQDAKFNQTSDISKYDFSARTIAALCEQHYSAGHILENLYQKGTTIKVENFMQSPTEGEYVDENSSLEIAIHQLVAGTHLSLLVTREKEIIGILRLSDVFAAVFHAMKNDESQP